MKNLKVVLVAMLVLGVTGLVLSQPAPGARPLRGTLVKVDGKNMVVKVMQRGGGEAKEETIVTDDKTKFMVDGEAGKLEDLKAEMQVTITPATGTAEMVRAFSKGLNGAVVKVDGKNVIIKSGRGDTAKEVTVVTDDKTKVIIDDKAAKLDDLKADMRVLVLPETGTATKIIVMPNMGGPRTRPAGAPAAG